MSDIEFGKLTRGLVYDEMKVSVKGLQFGTIGCWLAREYTFLYSVIPPLVYFLGAQELREIADKLDELNYSAKRAK